MKVLETDENYDLGFRNDSGKGAQTTASHALHVSQCIYTVTYIWKFCKNKHSNQKHSNVTLPFVLRGTKSGARQFWGPRVDSLEARGRPAAGPGEGSSKGRRLQGRRAAEAGRQPGESRGPTRGAFPHLDEPAEDAEEPVLAVDRAAYAVPPRPQPPRPRPDSAAWVAVHVSARLWRAGAPPEAAGGGEGRQAPGA